jgi:hypothetical protein
MMKEKRKETEHQNGALNHRSTRNIKSSQGSGKGRGE